MLSCIFLVWVSFKTDASSSDVFAIGKLSTLLILHTQVPDPFEILDEVELFALSCLRIDHGLVSTVLPLCCLSVETTERNKYRFNICWSYHNIYHLQYCLFISTYYHHRNYFFFVKEEELSIQKGNNTDQTI